MSRKSRRNKQPVLERADRAGNIYYGPSGIQGGGRYGKQGNYVTIPNSILNKMLENMAPQKNQASDFAPGSPLRPYAGVVPKFGPRQFAYNVGWNINANDRTEGHPDVPTFDQLRAFAQLYDGVGICERVILDMIPKLEPQVTIRKHLAEQGAKDKHFEKEISEWRTFLEKPSPAQNLDIHSWLRMAITEQTQIDALAIFKHKNRGGGLYGLEIIDGASIKPILNERGMVPDAAQGFPAYQQYPYGVPGDLYTADDLFYYRESPRAFSAFGFSRIERVITRVNQALRKEQKDLSYFTEGNLPLGIMQVPDTSMWTPDQIDAYEQAWNSLIAGSQQQQVRTKFTQPGMEYTPIDQYPLDPEFDRFILNHLTAAYGLSMGDISFTEDIHKSSGDTQQNMMYRRTIAPLITIYAWILTQALSEAYHEDRFIISFGGYQEQEDMNTQAEAYQKFISVGAISPASVARVMKFPAIPETGPVLITNQGVTPLSNLEEGSQLRQLHEALAAAGHDASALAPETLQDAKNGASSGTTPTTPPLAKNTAEPHSDAKYERSSMSLVEKQLAELLERFDTFSKGMIQVPHSDKEQKNRPEVLQKNTGMMLAFMLDPETAQKLAVPNGEPVDQLHCTLAYLGDMEDEITDDKLRPNTSPFKMRDAISMIASEAKPLAGNVGGIGRFQPAETETTPVIALVDVPGLTEFRTKLIQTVEAAGYFVADNHGYTPHITLAYINENEPMPCESVPTVPLTFDTVCLAVGDTYTYFKLGDEQYSRYWEEKDHDQSTQENPGRERATSPDGVHLGTGDQQTATVAERVSVAQSVAQGSDSGTAWDEREDLEPTKERKVDIKRWRARAIEDAKAGRTQRGFSTVYIPEFEHALISAGLARCSTVADVKNVFEIVRVGLQEQDTQKVSRMGECQCEVCKENNGKVIEGNDPPYHSGCTCKAETKEVARV